MDKAKRDSQEERPTVHLNIEVSAELRKELRMRALEDGMTLKDWLPRFLVKHLSPGAIVRP